MAKKPGKDAVALPSRKFERKELPVASAVFEDDDTVDEVDQLVEEVVALNAKIKADEETLKEKKTLLQAYMADIRSDASWSFRDDQERFTVTFIKPEKDKETLVREQLIAGMAAAKLKPAQITKILEKATKRTPVSPFVQVKVLGEE